jgi:hypothetical protein
MLDLAFRDESEDVIRKAKAKSRKSSPKPTEVLDAPQEIARGAASGTPTPISSIIVPSSTLAIDESSVLFPDEVDWLSANAATSSLAFCIQPTIEDIAFNHFTFNFVRLPNGPSRGYFAYIEDMYRDGTIDDALRAAITASGLAGTATKSKSSLLMSTARREYAIALQKINAALRSPTESLKDTILLAIIIVAVFETIVGAKQCE